MTPENIRFHAAGHLAAAVLLANVGMAAAAKVVLGDVYAYANAPTVKAPPHVLTVISGAIEDPIGKVEDIRGLERIFMDPLNTTIENGNGGFGN